MNQSMPEVACPVCNLVQIYRGQKKCIHRGCEWKGGINVREPVSALQTSRLRLDDGIREDRRSAW